MVKFVEVVNETDFNPRMERTAVPRFSLGELWLNGDAVVKIQHAPGYKKLLLDGRLSPELNRDHHFTSITLNNCGIMETHVVVGEPSEIAARLNKEAPTLLKG